MRGQKGSFALFFAACILPLMFLLFSLSLDLTAYYSDSERSQRILDDAALYAYRFLPFENEARQAAGSYLARFNLPSDVASVGVEADGIRLEVQRMAPLHFPRLLGISDAAIPVTVSARVRGTPFDSFITMDVSSYLSPDVATGSAWGEPGEWPAAPYFSQPIFQPVTNSPRPDLLTQQCFNPAFSALKAVTINTFEYLAAFRLNAVGVGVFDGDPDQGIVEIRMPRPLSRLPSSDTGVGEASFLSYAKVWTQTEDCAAVAFGTDATDSYQAPPANRRLPVRGDFSGRPVDLIVPGSREFNAEYLPWLQVREVIWSQLTHAAQPGNATGLLLDTVTNLYSVDPMRDRGGLVDRPLKLGIIFAGNLPRQFGAVFPDSGVAAALESVIRGRLAEEVRKSDAPAHTKIYFVMLSHPGVLVTREQSRELQQFFDATLAAADISKDRFDIQVMNAASPEELLNMLSRHFVLLNKSVVVSS